MINKNYTSDYIHKALNEEKLEAPDKEQANGEMEVVETLYRAHQKGGIEAARQTWNNLLELSPEKKQLIDPPAKKKHLYTLDELLSLPPKEWLIDNMIGRNSIIEIHGAPNVGKSLYTVDLLMNMAFDETVVYVTAEDMDGYKTRCAAWIEYYGRKPKHIHFYEKAVNLLDNSQVLDLINEVQEVNPSMIVFDTLSRCMVGGDENSARDMGLVIQSCDTIKNQLNTSVAMVHHTGKSGTSARGSSALEGACDTMMYVTNENNIMTVKNVKQRNAKLFKDIYKAIVEVGDSVVVTDLTDELRQQAQLGQNEIDILTIMNEAIYQTAGVTNSIIEENTGISGGTLTRALSYLKKMEYISQTASRKPYFITLQGQAILKDLS